MAKKTIFPADYPYSCMLCGKEHPKGTRSLFEGERLVSADCKWPDKSKSNANPEATKVTPGSLPQRQRPSGTTGRYSPLVSQAAEPASATYDIDAQFLKSKQFIEENFGAEDYVVGQMIAEHSRQKFEIYMFKQRKQLDLLKIKAYGKVE